MYTLEQLRGKNLNELKKIGWQLNVLPAGDRRCRQNWIDAIAGVNSPLLELLEASPGVEVEPVQEAIEIQHQEPIEIQAQEPIAQAAETSPGVDRPIENFTEADQPPNRGDSGRGRIETEAEMLESAIASNARFSPDIERDPSRAKQQWITFSARFFALYPPYFGEVNYKAIRLT